MKDTYKIFRKKLLFLELFTTWGFRHAVKEILRILKASNCKTVLEVCYGTGKLAEKITKNGMEVIGIDMSETMLNRAIKKKRAKKFIFQDATRMDFKEKFDVAIIQLALHEMSPEVRKKVFDNMKTAVKKNGLLIVSDFASTNNKSINSKINGYFIVKAEKSFLKTYPEHYYNYKEFIQNGGIKGFLKDEKIYSENYFLGGHSGVIAITN